MGHEMMPRAESKDKEQFKTPEQLQVDIRSFLKKYNLEKAVHNPNGEGGADYGRYPDLGSAPYQSMDQMAKAAGSFEGIILAALNE